VLSNGPSSPISAPARHETMIAGCERGAFTRSQVKGEVGEQNRQLREVRRQMENQNRDAGTESRLASLQESEQRDRESVTDVLCGP
jgi:hypothetical protein